MQTPVAAETIPSPRRRGFLAALALSLVIAGPVCYVMLMEIPWILSSGLPAFALMIVGCVIGIMAATSDQRWRIRVVAAVNVALTGLFAFGFFVLAGIPESETFATISEVPEFVLPDEEGNPVSLRDTVNAGPVLLVFYRGYW